EEEQEHRQQLSVTQECPCLLSLDQRTDQVRTRFISPLLYQAIEVDEELVPSLDRAHRNCRISRRTQGDRDLRRCPPEEVALLRLDPQQFSDHGERQRVGEVCDDIHLLPFCCRVQQALHN